jgi:hypothetical protein
MRSAKSVCDATNFGDYLGPGGNSRHGMPLKRPGTGPAFAHQGCGCSSGAPEAAEEAAFALVIIIIVIVVIDGRRVGIDIQCFQCVGQ